MRTRNSNQGESLNQEYIPVELQRISQEEFEMWDQEPCIASAD